MSLRKIRLLNTGIGVAPLPFLLLLLACSGGEKKETVNYVASLGEWVQPPPAEDKATELSTEQRTKKLNGQDVQFECTRTRHDVRTNSDDILALGGAQANLKPGMLLQGEKYRKGLLSSIPIRRSPLTLSINLGIAEPTVQVEDPNSATLQQGLSILQDRANALGQYPAQVAYERSEVSSMEELTVKVGASFGYDGLLAKVDFKASFEQSHSEEKHTIVAKLMQPMYTVSFADDALPTVEDFFAADVADEDFAEQEAAGTMSTSNLPVFISSVTYGRMVLFTATSSDVSDSKQISAALDASYQAFKLGASVDVAAKKTLSELQIKVLSLGGNESSVTEAIQSGDYSALFGTASATSAVPLRFAVKNLSPARPGAGIGDALSYVVEDCVPIVPDAPKWETVETSGAPDTRYAQVSASKGTAGVAALTTGGGVAFYDASLDAMKVNPNYQNVRFIDLGLSSGKELVWRRGTMDADYEWILMGDDSSLAVMEDNSLDHLGQGGSWGGDVGGDFDCARLSSASKSQFWCLAGNPRAYKQTEVRRYSYNSNSHEVVGHENMGNGTSIKQIAAASESEVWAITASNKVVRYNFDENKWDSPYQQPADGIAYLAAGPKSKLWGVSDEGKIIHLVGVK